MGSALRRHLLAFAFGTALVLAGCGDGGDDGGGGNGGTPAFADIAAGLTGVGRCSLLWGDYDNDGDLDLALSGDTGSDNGISKIYRNDDGGTFVDIVAGLTGVFMSSLAWGDYDNDGDLDLTLAGDMGSGCVTKVYRNDGGTLTDIGAGLTGIEMCSIAWGDYDNDGDLDLALAGWSGMVGKVGKVYRNNGGTFTDIGAGLTEVYWCSIAWGDYDNDGDLDLALAGDAGTSSTSRIYRNDSGTFTDIGAGLTGVDHCSIAWGDYDNDGDLDLGLAGSWHDGTSWHYESKVYRNDSGTFTDIGAQLTGVDRCSIAWGDYDNDGDLDLALAGWVGTGNVSKIYRNDAGTFTDIGAGLACVHECSIAWGDYDNDGDLDLALAGSGGAHSSKVYRNNGTVPNTAPTAPTGLSASYAGAGPYDITFSWADASDTETPADGLSYNLRVGTTPGGNDILSGMADVTTGRRSIPVRGAIQPGLSTNEWTLTLPPGTYSLYWGVQAVDTAFCGSAWATEETVTVP